MEVKRGVFYGVSVGPGDPELLTLKALRVLEACSVIAAPQTGSGDTLAMDIVRQAVSLEGKPLLPLPFTMAQDPALRQEAHQRAAWEIENFLAAGRDVAMLNLGDVSIYATYGYLQKLLKARGYQTEMIPGVSSFCARRPGWEWTWSRETSPCTSFRGTAVRWKKLWRCREQRC